MSVATLQHEVMITGIRRCGAYKVLALAAPDMARTARPGQFVNIGLDPDTGHLLRRPFSIYRTYADEGLVEIAFDVLGPGTQWIATRPACTFLDVVGPLGTPFAEPTIDGRAVMVGGGYGASALFQLAHELRSAGRRTTLIAGAATEQRVFGIGETSDAFDEVIITTDDGSAGVRGLVTDAMTDVDGAAAVYACGPMPMLAAVAALAGSRGIACHVATEEFMACGIGVCWTCVVPVRTSDGVKMQRCCTEGPVFDGSAVEWR
ncbi:MAG: dihydroorotate dehydrogenase electron transfer subunit [Actinomycetota bacterium]|nr:dihydroorotate dehydrogenase electron transfer subunit [Actinomycetota bacterium]